MSGMHEYSGHQSTVGGIRVNLNYVSKKKPAWLVMIKFLCLGAMLPIGYVLILPSIPFPLWQSMAVATGVIMLYVGLAFFIRPEANGDNMGYFGGAMNDPTRISDNVNRWLWQLHCLLGPGRFVATTLLDACILVGLMPEVDEQQLAEDHWQRDQAATAEEATLREQEIMGKLEKRRAGQACQGQQQLASARFLDPERFEQG